MTTVLHVEDDELFGPAVESLFDSFGFPGQFLIATTLKDAERILAEQGRDLDLVISDMNLPDGTGLDVVRTVRASVTHGHAPVLILSDHADASRVGRAYALGASSYVTKTGRGRTTAQILRTIYDHWLQDARLPVRAKVGRTRALISRAISMRGRVAQYYLMIAVQRSTEEDFWIGNAQREANLANLMMFLLSQIGGHELPDDVLDELERLQQDTRRVMDELDRKPPMTRDDALRSVIALGMSVDSAAFARGVGLLFPASPRAMTAFLDAIAAHLELMAAYIEAHTSDAELRQRGAQLGDRILSLRASRPVDR
jgi:CheY-like chemotaxis protein